MTNIQMCYRQRDQYVCRIDTTLPTGRRDKFESTRLSKHTHAPLADLAASSVDNVGTTLHLGNHRVVEHVLGLGVEGAVDGDNVAHLKLKECVQNESDNSHRFGVKLSAVQAPLC